MADQDPAPVTLDPDTPRLPGRPVPKGMHAVMAQRVEPAGSLDVFPTQPWATRAFCEYVLDLKGQRVWECACHVGHMAKPLAEYAGEVVASDIHDYGFGSVFDFLTVGSLFGGPPFGLVDWVITNPPFNLLDEFIDRGLQIARRGVAFFGRIQLLETVGRYERIWQPHRGRVTYAQYVERVPLVRGRIEQDASSAASYGWVVIDKRYDRVPLIHIPPCRAQLERDTDYIEAA